MYLSKYFTQSEITCKCGCGLANMHQSTLNIADAVREWYGKPIVPTSGCRCPRHNKSVGGSAASYHLPHPTNEFVNGVMVLRSRAMDLPMDDPKACAKWLDANYPDISYLVYNDFIHIDTRDRRYTRYMTGEEK